MVAALRDNRGTHLPFLGGGAKCLEAESELVF